MKYLIRSAKPEDAEQIKALAKSFYLFNLPPDLFEIQKKIRLSEKSFAGLLPFEKRTFLFVLEEKGSKKLIGSSQIPACHFGQKHPCWKLDEQTSSLHLNYVESSAAQLGGLIVLPQRRGGPEKPGLQIGAFRFLYMLKDPQVWPENVEVSLTAPWQKEGAVNEFWNAVGRKIFSLPYAEAGDFYQKDLKGFCARIPKNMTVDLRSLPEGARAALQKVHPETEPLRRSLLKMGFKQTENRHFLDGGLSLQIKRRNVPFIARGGEAVWEGALPSESDSRPGSPARGALFILKQGEVKRAQSLLWGQDFKGGFRGGVFKGELKKDKTVLLQRAPEDLNLSKPCLVTPLSCVAPV